MSYHCNSLRIKELVIQAKQLCHLVGKDSTTANIPMIPLGRGGRTRNKTSQRKTMNQSFLVKNVLSFFL